MTCKETQLHLTALLDNELSEPDTAELKSHLLGCADCRQTCDALRATEALADSWAVTEEEDIWPEIASQLTFTELAALRNEISLLRTEIQALRGEVTDLRDRLTKKDLDWLLLPPTRQAKLGLSQGDNDPWNLVRS